MDAHHLLSRHREQAEGILLAEIALVQEGEPRQVGELVEILGADTRRVEAGAVMGDVAIRVPERPLEPRELQRGELVSRGALDGLERRIPCRAGDDHHAPGIAAATAADGTESGTACSLTMVSTS